MAGLDPAIHHFKKGFCQMDARVKPAHDEFCYASLSSATSKFGASWFETPLRGPHHEELETSS